MNRLPTTILVATDGSHDAALAATAAAGLSNASGSELHLVHVLQQFPRYAFAVKRRSWPGKRMNLKSKTPQFAGLSVARSAGLEPAAF